MSVFPNILKPAVAAAGIVLATVTGAIADSERLERLMGNLRNSTPENANLISKEIQLEWEKSGSAAADLLLSRGRKSMEAGQIQSAIEHFTALTDHAPHFAEGWVSRASVFAHAEMFGPAIDDLETALRLNPEHFEAIIGLGAILEVLNRPNDAFEAYQLVQPIHPHHPAVTEALERLEPVVKGRNL